MMFSGLEPPSRTVYQVEGYFPIMGSDSDLQRQPEVTHLFEDIHGIRWLFFATCSDTI